MSLHEEISARYPEDEIALFDEFEDAFLGITNGFGGPRALYSEAKVLEILKGEALENGDSEEIAEEAAMEHYDYNVRGTYCGAGTPLFLEHTYFDLKESW